MKPSLKKKKWTLKTTAYFIDLAMVNSGIIYKHDAKANELPRKKQLITYRSD